MSPETIKLILQQEFPDGKIDVTGDGHHFEAAIISPAFIGKSRLQQQQMVYAVLNPYILNGEIHAITLKTNIPKER